jgi:uncharacterized membrane protein YphA (DoxX/SURF4 family)
MSDVLSFTTRTANGSATTGAWHPVARVFFRFIFTYLVLSACFWIFEFADKSTAFVARPYHAFWRPLVRWTAAHVFHWSGNVDVNFVRDTRYLYALLTCFLAASLIVTLVWSIADRNRKQYAVLNHWLRVLLRYELAYLLLHYGMDKVFLLQFPAPTLARLTERFGDYSPSSLMWAFIGASTVYTVFGGLAEILGGVLLLFRRTTTLGALISFAVMFNVTVMDFSYDVAVKLLCLNMLLMAVYLMLPDVGRLLHFFFLNLATQPAQLAPFALERRKQLLATVLKACVILYLIVPLTIRDWKNYKQSGAGAPHPPMYGLYQVEDFSLGGVAHPPLVTDASRWRYVIIDKPDTLTIRRMDDSLTDYRVHFDAAQHEFFFDAPGDPINKSALKISQMDARSMQLQGSFGGATLNASLKEIDRSSFTLVNRGFHWISETSFIR